METEKPSTEKLIVSEASRVCTSCGKSMSLTAKFCVECGHNAEEDIKNCTQCGQKTNPNEKFCESCGWKVAAVPQDPQNVVGYGIPVDMDSEPQD